MNRFNFEQTGGFPLTQDRLKWLQDSYLPAFNALASLSGSDQTVVISGVELLSGSWVAGEVSPGWVYDPTMGLVPFLGGSFTSTSRGLAFVDETTTLYYANLAPIDSQIARVAKIVSGNSYALRDLSERRFAHEMGNSNRTEWQTVALSTGVAGELKFRLDKISKLVHMKGFADIPGGTGSASYLTTFKNIPAPDPSFSLLQPFLILLSNPGTDTDFVIDAAGVKQHQSIGKMSPANLSGGITNIDGLRIAVRLFQTQNPGMTYRNSFSFSYHYD